MIVLLIVLIAILILCIMKIYVFDDKVKNENRVTKKTSIKSIGQLPLNEYKGNIILFLGGYFYGY